MEIKNTGGLADDFVWRGSAGLMTQYLGKAAGSGRLYVNIDHVPPGAYSAKYHSHTRQEEFFLILDGQGLLRFDGQEYDVSKGDFIAKPAGRGIAHQFFNNGGETLVILDAGTVESEDICDYPDEQVSLVKMPDGYQIRGGDENWSSDPNTRQAE